MQDTFYLEQTDGTGDNLVLRTHTSSWQNEVMKKYGAPCKVMLPGKVFRYENTDASHDTTFWQLEGIVVDEKDKISLAHLIRFLEKFFSTVFGQAVKIRLRPAYFPFVEPGFEGDVSCPICNGKGCSLCK
jgi:phenylalanyl-tRNA synthetase alpha chain